MGKVHPTIDIAGTAWPLYKLEALAAGLIVGVLLALLTGSLQIAVLTAAAVAALRWTASFVGTRKAATRRPALPV